jgi:hypothetical protein
MKMKKEQIAVELTDNQLRGIFDRCPYKATFDEFVEGYREWAKTQNLVKPEVKEITVGFTDEQIIDFGKHHYGYGTRCNCFVNDFKKWQVTQTFVQPQQFEPVVVGLSDKQVSDISEAIVTNLCIGKSLWEDVSYEISRYLKTQTFVQAQLFDPSWDIIPSRVDEVEIVMNYCKDGMILDNGSNFLISYKRPKPPAPKVEVDKDYYHKKTRDIYTALGFIRTYVNGGWEDYVKYANGNGEYSKPIDDFLAKFERVQS